MELVPGAGVGSGSVTVRQFYCTVLYCTVLYCSVLYCTLSFSRFQEKEASKEVFDLHMVTLNNTKLDR